MFCCFVESFLSRDFLTKNIYILQSRASLKAPFNLAIGIYCWLSASKQQQVLKRPFAVGTHTQPNLTTNDSINACQLFVRHAVKTQWWRPTIFHGWVFTNSFSIFNNCFILLIVLVECFWGISLIVMKVLQLLGFN